MGNLLCIGNLKGPFGIKGQIKLISDVDHQDKVFRASNKIIINNAIYEIENVNKHKNNLIIKFVGLDKIEDVEHLFNQDIYIKKDDIKLEKEEYLNIELIGLDIIETNENLGKVQELLLSKKCTYIKSNNLIIPLIDKYLEKVDIVSKKIIVKNIKELMI